KRQQQRRQLQQKDKSSSAAGTAQLKRKRESHKPSVQNKGSTNLDAYFTKSGGLVKAHTAPLASSLGAMSIGGSPFAATPRDLKSNPFDIIEDAMNPSQDRLLVKEEETVVIGDAQFSDSDSDTALPDYAWEAGDEYRGLDSDDDELGLNENDPSLYRLSSSASAMIRADSGRSSQTDTPNKGTSDVGSEDTVAMQVDTEDNAKVNRDSPTSPALKETAKKPLPDALGIQKRQAPFLVFSKPPESLSLRTQLSVTAERPLLGLDQLKDEATLLAHTSLCKRPLLGADPPRRSLDLLADSLLYWEATSPELTPIASPPKTKQPPTSSTATAMQLMHQALSSLFILQKEAPEIHPYVYLCAREFTVVFQMVAQKEMSRHSSSNSKLSAEEQEAESQGAKKRRYIRVAVVSQSHMGLRRALNAKGIKFTLPLAPKVKHSWGELVDYTDPDAQTGDIDQHRLHDSSFDKTWRSAVLVMGDTDVATLFDHFKNGATALHDVHLYSPAPFLNATMRCATVKFSDVVTYDEAPDSTQNKDEEVVGNRPQATRIYKMDVTGIVFPSAWSTVLKAVADILDTSGDAADDGAQGFCVSSKELAATAHLNLLVSKQGSSVAGKKTVAYSMSTRKFMYK
ncbi:hypothetical protein EV175_004145, partial [Coemansia sp. RSA 1933]